MSAAPASEVRTPEARLLTDDSLVDSALVLFAERLELMPGVAAFKWQHHASIADPPREQAVIHAAGELAARQSLEAAPVERLFELQIRFARDLESDCERRWRDRGFDFAGPVPDLTSEVRPRLDRITREQLRALYLAAPIFARADFRGRYATRARQTLRGWPDDRVHELLDALSSTRLSGAPRLARIRASGMLKVGTTGDYAPFSSTGGGALRGVDIDLASALARNLGVEAVFLATSWPHLTSDFAQGRFDVALSGIADTPPRRAVATVSGPYLSGGKTILARCSDAARFASLTALDRPGVRLIVNPGGTNEQFVRERVHHASIRVASDNESVFDEIRAGRADAMITDDFEVMWQTRRHPELCRSFPGLLTRSDKVILIARDAGLVAAVERWQQAAVDSALPQKLLEHALSP